MIEFKQGVDPYETMQIGSNRPVGVGDQYRALLSLVWDFDTIRRGYWRPAEKDTDKNFIYLPNDLIIKIVKINKKISGFGIGVLIYNSTFNGDMFVSYENLDKFFKRL
jgi:hypothetical protein